MPDRVFDESRDAGVSPLEPGCALVPLTVTAEPAAAPASAFRPDARFVVHLIATATHEPQTRALRRAAPSDAVSTYSNVVGFVGRPQLAANGLALARVA
jgi:hypothetical protein